ncbi:hypothetical protein NY10_1806 [Carnobacterium antarcticum]|nr:hypothetical protein NY10_1806 [Carnobacterium sp. CP1]
MTEYSLIAVTLFLKRLKTTVDLRSLSSFTEKNNQYGWFKEQ